MPLYEQLQAVLDQAERERPAKTILRAAFDRFAMRVRDGVPEEVADEIASSLMRPFIDKAAALIRTGRDDMINDLLAGLDAQILTALKRARESGRLKAWDPQAEIKAHLAVFQTWRWESRLIDTLRDNLAQGETIREVGPHGVVTTKRELGREQLQAMCRLQAETNDANFAAQFLTREQIDHLVEEVAKSTAEQVPSYGKNYDFGPSGARPAR
jgi:hypothetical protein